MDKNEISLQLTLKAIEHDDITFQNYGYSDDNAAEKQNAFNAKQIYEFYNAIKSNIDTAASVQK